MKEYILKEKLSEKQKKFTGVKKMIKMKKQMLRSMLSLFIIMMMLTATVFGADWTTYQQNNINSGIVPIGDYAPIGGTTQNMLDLPSGAWNGIDVAPLIRTEGIDTYAYMFLSTANDSRVAKIKLDDVQTGTGNGMVWGNASNGGLQIGTKGGFQLSTPVIVGNTMYIALTDQAQKLENTTFDTNLAYWTTAVTGGATISHDTDGVDNFAKINQATAAATTGSLTQTTNTTLNASDKVRITLRYKVQNSTGATIKIYARPVGVATFTEVYSKVETSTTNWIDVNTDVTTKFGTTAFYEIKYEVAFTPSSSGSVLFDNAGLMAENLMLKKIPDVTSGSPTVQDVVSFDGKGGQFNTPIKYDSSTNSLFLGSWKGGGTGAYYKVNLTGTPSVTEFNAGVSGEGYYWAGAAFIPSTNYVVFGGDKSNVYVVNKTNMSEVNRYTIKGTSPGQVSTAAEIRSAICYDNGKIYFTDKGGFLWCLNINTSTGVLTYGWHEYIGYSTSTPVVYGDRVYVGVGSFGVGYLKCVDKSNGDIIWSYATTSTEGGVQSSPIVYEEDDVVYIYFTTNGASGVGICIMDDDTGGAYIWDTNPGTYALQGMAAGDGYAVFGNDYGEVYVIKD